MQLVNKLTGEITSFEPAKVKKLVAQADAGIKYAKEIKDWDLLEKAVDFQVSQQRQFVAWWDREVGKNHGGNRRNQVPRSSHLKLDDAEELTGISHQQVSKWRHRTKDEAAQQKYREQLSGPAYQKAMAGEVDNHRAQGTGQNEWYTPAAHVDAARDFLVGIDLDPATSEQANECVGAGKIFTEADNGLLQDWGGRVWLNPPYAQPAIHQFVDKLVGEVASGRVTEAVMLTHNYTDTQWFHNAASAASAICFTRGRISFENPAGEKASPTQGQAFFYFGSRVDEFASAFARFGFVMVRHEV